MAIVIKSIDMPDVCWHCPFFCDDGDYPTCYITAHSTGYRFPYRKKRMDDCPIEETVYIEDEEL